MLKLLLVSISILITTASLFAEPIDSELIKVGVLVPLTGDSTPGRKSEECRFYILIQNPCSELLHKSYIDI